MKFKIALCQIKGSLEKNEAKEKVTVFVKEAAKNGAQVVVLPEMWNCPYSNQYFFAYSEPENGPSVDFMAKLAKANSIILVGGSIPEMHQEKIYNTCYVFSPEGQLLGKHRKIHLFDVNIPNGIRFMESETLAPGENPTIVSTDLGKMGIAICYDVRFPKLFELMAEKGAKLMILPAAFNMTTGPVHWDLLMRSRALDNQVYFAACSPARDIKGVYSAYGHSCIVNPWGEFCGKADSLETIVYAHVDLKFSEEIRSQIPLSAQQRSY